MVGATQVLISIGFCEFRHERLTLNYHACTKPCPFIKVYPDLDLVPGGNIPFVKRPRADLLQRRLWDQWWLQHHTRPSEVDAAVWFVNDTTLTESEIVIGESAEVIVQYVYQGCDATDEVLVTFEPSLDMSKVVMPNISLNLCTEDELITIEMNIFNRWDKQLV